MVDDPKTVKLLYDVSKERENFEHAQWAASDEKAKIIIGFIGFVMGVALLWGADKLLSNTTETIFIIIFIIPFIFFYQLDLITPGSFPSEASVRKQIRQIPNFLRKALGRPQIGHRL